MLYLGIDGGGSKTTFLLEDDAGRTLAHFQTGPSNLFSVGEIRARQSIIEGITKLPVRPDAACAGFAGAGRPDGLRFYRECLESVLPNVKILVETDAFVGYMGAIGTEPGVLLIAGTGSIAIGRRTDGVMIRVGGWGPYFGDEGGGHWIGREAVRAALHATDAHEFPEFISAIRLALRLESMEQVVTAWNSGKLDVSTIASLAPIVFQQHPSEPSNRILHEAAAHLRTILRTAVAQVGTSYRLAIAGSIFRQREFR